jgi:hypothetical protein
MEMPQIASNKGPDGKIRLSPDPSRELIEGVYGYIKAQQPCRIGDVIDAIMRQFFPFPGSSTRDAVKPLVIKAMFILANYEERISVGFVEIRNTELNLVHTIK